MIQKETLFLGAWVCIPELIYDYGDGDSCNGYFQVTKIEDYELWTAGGLDEIGYDRVDPIPLTPEILDKLGMTEFVDVALFDHETGMQKDDYKGATRLGDFHELQYLMKMIHGKDINPL